MIPLGDLPNLMSVMAITVLIMRGNVIRSVIMGIPVIAGYLYIATAFSPLYTELSREIAETTGMALEGGYGGLITAFTDGESCKILVFPYVQWEYRCNRSDPCCSCSDVLSIPQPQES